MANISSFLMLFVWWLPRVCQPVSEPPAAVCRDPDLGRLCRRLRVVCRLDGRQRPEALGLLSRPCLPEPWTGLRVTIFPSALNETKSFPELEVLLSTAKMSTADPFQDGATADSCSHLWIQGVTTPALALPPLPCVASSLMQNCKFTHSKGHVCHVTRTGARLVVDASIPLQNCSYRQYDVISLPPGSDRMVTVTVSQTYPAANQTNSSHGLSVPAPAAAAGPGRPGRRRERSSGSGTVWIPHSAPPCSVDQQHKAAMAPVDAASPLTLNFVMIGATEGGLVLHSIPPASLSFHCTVLMDGSQAALAPAFCARDYTACRLAPTLQHAASRGLADAWALHVAAGRQFVPFCTCRVVHHEGGRSRLVAVRPSPPRLKFHAGSRLQKVYEYSLLAAKMDAMAIVPGAAAFLHYPSDAVFMVGRRACPGGHRVSVTALLQRRLHHIAFATRLVGDTTLCPALGAKMMALRVQPAGDCRVAGAPCPELGYVQYVYPFPWNSLLLRELALAENGRLLAAAFHLPLPPHVVQHLVPGRRYTVSQVVLPVGARLNRQGGMPEAVAATEALDFKYDKPAPGCVFQLELIAHNIVHNNLKSHCPPPLLFDTETGPFEPGLVEFTVKGVVFGFAAFFAAGGSGDEKTWGFSYDGEFVSRRAGGRLVKDRVTIAPPDDFTEYAYKVTVGSANSGGAGRRRITVHQFGVPLYESDFALGAAANLTAVQFGLPGFCGTTPGVSGRLARLRDSGQIVKVRLMLPRCGVGRCVRQRISGPFRREAGSATGRSPSHVLNVRPQFGWTHTLALHSAETTITFSEAVRGGDARRHLQVQLAGGQLQLVVAGSRAPLPELDVPLTRLLLRHSRIAQLNYSRFGDAGPPPSGLVATTLYVAYDLQTVELGLASAGTPFWRSNRGREGLKFRDAVHLEAAGFWSGVGMRWLGAAAAPRPALLRYVSQTPCLSEDARPRLPQPWGALYHGTPPACIFMAGILDNKATKQCVTQMRRCPRAGRYPRPGRARPVWPQCLYDARCAMASVIDDKADVNKLLSGKLDFALQVPTVVAIPFHDILGVLEHDDIIQTLEINFLKDKILVSKVNSNYKKQFTYVSVPMPADYLTFGAYHGFRIITSIGSDSHTSVRLLDLQQIRPDSKGDDVWSRSFSSRLILSRAVFGVHRQEKHQHTRNTDIVVDCVPSFDKCAGENPCRNGGTCLRDKCKCKPAYHGVDCSLTECPKVTCQHGGTCVPVDHPPYYACHCDEKRWTGKLCETMFDYCFSKPCQHGGTCTPQVGGFKCACPKGYGGHVCHMQTNICAVRHPCKNGATCHEVKESAATGDQEYRCTCTDRFTGPTCTVSRALKVAVFHLKKGMALANYPMKLAMQTRGSLPLNCFLDLKDTNYVEIGSDDLVSSAMSRKRIWRRQKFDVSLYHYRGGFYFHEFSHMYVRPGTYNITAKCTNRGHDTHVEVRPAVIETNVNPSLCVPTVVIRNTGLRREAAPSYYRRDTLRLYAITKSDCPTVRIDQVHWSVHSITEAVPYPTDINHAELPGTVVDRHDLKVPAYSLSYGLWVVKMRADAYLKSLGTVSAFELGWFRVAPHPLECVLAGGDVVSMPADGVALDGSASQDADRADGRLRGVAVQWRCWLSPSGQADAFCRGPQRALRSRSMRLRVAAGRLSVRHQYVFELRLSHAATRRNCTARQTVDVTPAGSARAAIICLYNCVGAANWQDKISFRADCPNCRGDYNVHWSITTVSGAGGIINWREDTSFGSNDKHLIINAGVLRPNASYHISVHVLRAGAPSNASGSAQMTTLRLNRAPSGGRCSVSPPRGTAGRTGFALTCSGWTSERPPLLYQFQQARPDGRGFAVLYEDINPSAVNMTLSIGDGTRGYSSAIRVRVSDATGLSSEVNVSVTVLPPVKVEEEDVLTYTKDVFKLLPSGLDKIAEAIVQGNFPGALQGVASSSELMNQITDHSQKRILDEDRKRELREQLLDALDEVPSSTLGTLQQTADAFSAVAGGHRDEYFPATVEKLINRTDQLAATLLREYGSDPSVPVPLVVKACHSVVRALSSALRVATEDVEAPSLEPVDLYYPNNQRDYEVFDEKRIAHIEDKRHRVARVADKFMKTAKSVYETLGKHLEPGESPKIVESSEISMWVQHFDKRTARSSTVVGLPANKKVLETDSNYAVLPNVADILKDRPDVKNVEVTVTTLKENPYWWDEESAKNVSTDIVNINVRSVPGYRGIKVGSMRSKMDIFLRRSSSDVEHVRGKAVLLDWYHTLNGRRNFPNDMDVANHKIILPPGGYSQVIQLIPIPQIALATDRRNPNITYEIPVKLFINYLRSEKASIHHMTHSFDRRSRRLAWTLPRDRGQLNGRDLDVFTTINHADDDGGIEEWYLGVMLHPETGKRLLNSTVLAPVSGHGGGGGAGGDAPTSVQPKSHDPEEELRQRYSMGRFVMKAREIHSRFVEDPEAMDTTSRTADGVTISRGWLRSRSAVDGVKAAETPSAIAAIYREDLLKALDRAFICKNTMTFHDCERKKSIKYNLTLFAARCMYWSDELVAFTDAGCDVGPLSTVDVLHCRCSHLTAFTGSFLVLPNKVDVTMLVNLNMILDKNPTAVYLMLALLAAYGLLFAYARKQDLRDVKRRHIIYLDDNDPRHRYAYLVTVYTGVQYKAGTTARVAIVLQGELATSETHLLTGERKRKRTLERGADSWFILTTAGTLGDLTELRIWHDNSGKNPEWFLDRVLVRDCQTDRVWVFLVTRWVHPVTGLLVTARPAALHEVTAWNTSVARRAEESLRDGHLWFSVFSRPLSSSFTRCQRLTCAMTLLMANMLASLMFYGVPTGDPSDQISRGQSFGLGWRDLVISAESAVLVGLALAPVIVLFRRSRPLDDQKRTVVTEAEHEAAHGGTGKGSDLEEAANERRGSAAGPAGADGSRVRPPTDDQAEQTGQAAPEVEGSAAAVRRASLQEMQRKVSGGADAQLRDAQPGLMLPWWFLYVAWALAALIILFCAVLCLAYSAQYGEIKCYIWLASSGVSLLQSIVLIQPLVIVGFSWLAAWCCRAAPEVENRSAERPQQRAFDRDMATAYAQSINAKRTLPMYRQVPKRKLRKLRAKKMKNLLTHEAIKDIATFLVYIACLLLIIHGNKDSNAYYSTQTARNMFVEGNMVDGDDDAVKLADATDLGGVIKYLNTTFIRTVHKGSEYNGSEAQRDGMTRQDSLFFVGVVRLRQVRITRDACRPPDKLFWMNFTACKRPFAWRHEDTADYGQNWSPQPDYHDDPWTNEATEAWIHKDAGYLRALPFTGEHATYPGSGYTLHLGRRTAASQVVIDYLSDTSWLDAYTRALFVEFTLYNADSDLFNLVVILFEQTRIGSVTPTCSIRTSKLYVDTDVSRLTMYMTAFYVFFIVCNTMVEFRKLYRFGFKAYAKDMWNVLDFLLVLMGYVCVALYIYRYVVLEEAFENLRSTDENKFANFYIPVFYDFLLTYVQAFALILTMAKFWKILTFNKRMVTFSLTLQYSRKDLRAFFLIFAIAVVGYAYWANIVFGSSLDDFRDMWPSLMSLILFAIGTFDFNSYVSADRIFGIVFFISYVFFVMIYLINVMLSIIMTGYEMAMDDMQHLVTKYDVVDVFIWEVRNFFEDSSSSSEDEGRMAAARTRQRRRTRRLMRWLFPCCIQKFRDRDLRRPVEQEELRQLQRFMSRTAAGGAPPLPTSAAEDSPPTAEAVGRRRPGMIEPEDEDDEDETAAPPPAGPAPRLLDEADVAPAGRLPARRVRKARRRRRRRSGASPRLRHGPPVPKRKSVQNDHRFLPTLTGAPDVRPREQRPERSASSRRRSSGNRRRSSGNRRRSSGNRRQSSRLGTSTSEWRRSSVERSRWSSSSGHGRLSSGQAAHPQAGPAVGPGWEPGPSGRRHVAETSLPPGQTRPTDFHQPATSLSRAGAARHAPKDVHQPSTSGLSRVQQLRYGGQPMNAAPGS